MKRAFNLGVIASSNNPFFVIKSSGIRLYLFLLLMMSGGGVHGQIISWNFTSGNTPNTNLPGGTTAVSFNTGGTTTTSGCTGNGYTIDNWNVNEYFQIIAPTTGYNITTMTFNTRSSGTGPRNFKVQYSSTGTGGTFTDLGTTFISPNGSCSGFSADFTAVNALDNNANTVIRLVFTGGEADGSPASGDAASGGTFRVDDLIINGAAIPSVVVPTVTTPTVSSITTTTATLGATVTNNGGATLTSRGTVWGTSATPTGNILAEGGTAVAAYTHGRTGFTANTLYYYRGYAVNSAGTGYSGDGTFTTVHNAPVMGSGSGATINSIDANWTAPASAGPAAFTYTVEVDNDPAFGSIDFTQANIASGTLTTNATGLLPSTIYYYRVKAVNAGGSSAWSSTSAGYTTLTPTTPVVTGASPSGTVGSAFSYSIVATNSPTSYAISSGTLPTGLNLNTTTGQITGTPTTAGSSSVDVTATNVSGTSAAATLNFTIAKGNQTISGLAATDSKTYGDANYALSTTASSGLTVSYSSSDTNVATVSGNTVTIVENGTTTITAMQAGDSNWNAASNTTQTLTVNQKALTITGLTGVNRVYDATTTATTTGTATLDGIVGSDDVSVSGTPVLNFTNKTVANGKAITVTGYTLAGTTASRYTLTQPTGLTANVTAAPLTITGAAASNKTYNGTTAATITGTLSGILLTDVVTLNGTGTFDTANAGTGKAVTSTSTLGGADAGNYTLTQPIGLTADITKANQTITFGALPAKTTSDADFSPGATSATSGTNPITYTSATPSVATIVGSNIHIVGAGTSVITASQAASTNYNAAPDVQQTLTVSTAPVTLANYLFNGTSCSSYTPSNVITNLTFNSIAPIGITCNSNVANAFSGSASWGTSINTSTRYLEFTVTADSGYLVTTASLVFDAWRSGAGATNYEVRSSLDSFGSNLGSGAVTTTSATKTVTLDSSFENLETVTFRIYGYGGSSTGDYRLDNISLIGNVTTGCTQPSTQASALTATTATVDGFSTNWTAGTGNGTMIVVRPTAQTNQNPTSGTSYTANLAWTSAGQINTNNRVVFRAAGTSAGPITGLTAETQYTVTAYEYNTTDECYNTTSAPTASIYTLSTEPTAHSATFTNTVVDYQQINLAFSASAGIGADGYVILRRADGVAPTTSGIVDGVAPASWTLPSGTVLVTTTTSGTTFNNTGLSGSTAYCYLLVPYNWNGSITGTYNYRTTATVPTTCGTTPAPPSLISDIINYETGFTYTDNIDYKSFQSSTITDATNNVAVFNFKVRDGGSALSDTDTFPTILQGLVINYTGQASTINKAELFSGSTKISAGSTVAANSITFNLSNLGNAAFTVADNTETTFTLRVTFNTTALDNDKLVFSVGSATAGSTNTSSQFTTITAQSDSNTGNDKNRIEVTADRLAFVQQPNTVSINTLMSPSVTVSANDVNGNRDLDQTGNVSITSTGTLTGTPVSEAFSSGLATFSSLTHTVAATGRTLSAASTGLTGIVSTSFDITEIVYVNGDFRSTSDGNWHSTAASNTASWESFNGSIWAVSSAPGTNAASLGTKTVYIRNNIFLVGTNTAPNVVIENGGILSTSTVGATFVNLLVKSGGKFNRESNASGVSGIFEVEDNGTVTFKHTSLSTSRSTTIWAGTEKFHANSNFEIVYSDNTVMPVVQASGDVSTYTDPITNTTACFGNVIINCSTGKANVVHSGFNSQLTHKDLIYRSNSDTAPLSAGSITTTIGGNIIIENTYDQSSITLSGSAVTIDVTVKGNIEHNDNTIFRPTTNLSANSTLTVEGNIHINSTGTINMNAGSGALVGTSILNLKGDLYVANSGSLISTATGSNSFNFNGTGDGSSDAQTQTIDVVNQSTASNIAFTIKRGAYVKLINQNFALGTASTLTVESSATSTSFGGTLDFGFDGTNGAGTNALAVTGPSFVAQTGSVLKITSPDGITPLGTATGNVRTTTTRTYATSTPFGDYYYIGKSNQITGTGLPANVRNLVVNNEAATSNLTITNANVSATVGAVSVNGLLTMQQGNIISTPTNLLQIGISTGTPGTLTHIDGVVKGDGVTEGAMRRYTANTTATGQGFFPLGTTANLKRFITTEFTGTNGGYLDATFVVGEDMGDNGLLDLSTIPAVGTCPAFTVLNTDEDLFWRVTPQTGTLTSGTHKVTLRKDSNSNICKETVLKRTTTTADWINPGDHLEGTVEGGDIIVSREAMTGTLKDFGLGNGNCSSTSIVYNGGAWPTTISRLTPIEINADVALPLGISQVCECWVSENVTLTIPEGATLEVVNGITLEDGATADNNGKIIIEDSGSLVQITDVENATENNNTGNIRMQRFAKPMYRFDYTYWSSPVKADPAVFLLGREQTPADADNPIPGLSPQTLFNKYFDWDQSGQGWNMIPYGNAAMTAGRGYIVRAPQTYNMEGVGPSAIFEANFIGVPNNGIVRHPVSGSSDVNDNLWNLLGNPYPSAIDADLFCEANVGPASGNDVLGGTLYFWTHNTNIVGSNGIYSYNSADYASYNGTGGTGTTESAPSSVDIGDYINTTIPSGKIAAGQAFFVKGIANGEAIFNNSMRVTGNNDEFFRPAPTTPVENWQTTGKHRVWLNIKGQTKGFSQALVGYIENATNDLDIRFDGESFGGNQVTLYSVLNNKKLVIQGRALPFDNQDQVPLGYKTTLIGTLTISIDHLDGLLEG
ncbi:YDG domain-containing protein, partial [Flavobacterium soli]|uniref:YDG domain-containing protein n=1 Tax=Flavobacterium soli TaxID=344881 RepID=UPI001FE1F289